MTANNQAVEMAAHAAQLQTGLTQARQQLHAALLSGSDTAAIRSFIADLEQELTGAECAAAEVEAEATAAEAAAVEAEVERIAVATIARIEGVTADLQIEPIPSAA